MPIQPPAALVEPNSENRLIPALRQAAQNTMRTGTVLSILEKSATEFYLALKNPAQAVQHNMMGQAYADLAVTGRNAYNMFRASKPQDQTILHPTGSALAVSGISVDSAMLTVAVAKTLDRSYEVASALRTGANRASLGYIAVSGEDDPAHRPVNVATTGFPQFEISVAVPGVGGAVACRFIIAANGPVPSTAPSAGKRTVPADAAPQIPDGYRIALFLHGHGSSAEEAADIIPELLKQATKRNEKLAVVAFDLPNSGYSSRFDHTKVPSLAPDKMSWPHGVFDNGPVHTPVLDYIENFIVAFVDELHRHTHIKDRFAGVFGGSLGGNMGLRLGRRDPKAFPWLANGIFSWSPACVWDAYIKDELKRAAPQHCLDKLHEVERPDSRVHYFQEVFAGKLFDSNGHEPLFSEAVSAVATPRQPEQWYRGGDWQACKTAYIAESHLGRHETYHADFRLWHWRVGGEQLLYSHMDQVDRNVHNSPPRYTLNKIRQFIASGEVDNYNFTGIYSATMKMVGLMGHTPGQSMFLKNTGHSIHCERPAFLAEQMMNFFDANVVHRSATGGL